MISKVITLSVLYFVQGLPYGFQDKFIPMYLRTTGLSHTKLSLMKLLLLPWLCKAAFGLLIDLKWSKWLWLLLSLAALTLTSILGTFINTDYFIPMCAWLFFLNLFSAFQDVSVDALVMHIFQECEIGLGNTAQVVGYKLGALFGGGVLFWVHHFYGWNCLCYSLTSLYIIAIIVFFPMYFGKSLAASNKISNDRTINIRGESDSVKKKDIVPNNNESSSKETLIEPLSIEKSNENMLKRRILQKETSESFADSAEIEENIVLHPRKRKYNISEIAQLIINTKGTIPVIVFILFYKLGERGALSTFPVFLVDQGVSTTDIGIWSGVVGQLASFTGSICSGWIISCKWDLRSFLHKALLARTVPVIIEWIIVSVWFTTLPSFIQSIMFYYHSDMVQPFGLKVLSVVSLIMLEFTAGLVTTCVFTLMMSCALGAPASLQATHYSVLSSIETAGKLLFSSISGALIDWMGLSCVYFLFVVLSAPMVLILRFIKC